MYNWQYPGETLAQLCHSSYAMRYKEQKKTMAIVKCIYVSRFVWKATSKVWKVQQNLLWKTQTIFQPSLGQVQPGGQQSSDTTRFRCPFYAIIPSRPNQVERCLWSWNTVKTCVPCGQNVTFVYPTGIISIQIIFSSNVNILSCLTFISLWSAI